MSITNPVKNLAQQVVKQMVQEPWEILKQAGHQVVAGEQVRIPDTRQELGQEGTVAQQENEKPLAERDRIRSQRLIQALQSELTEIKKVKEQKKLLQTQQEKIAQEQKEQTFQSLVEPVTKPSRKFKFFGTGRKSQVERQQTRVERPLPPSG